MTNNHCSAKKSSSSETVIRMVAKQQTDTTESVSCFKISCNMDPEKFSYTWALVYESGADNQTVGPWAQIYKRPLHLSQIRARHTDFIVVEPLFVSVCCHFLSL